MQPIYATQTLQIEDAFVFHIDTLSKYVDTLNYLIIINVNMTVLFLVFISVVSGVNVCVRQKATARSILRGCLFVVVCWKESCLVFDDIILCFS
jgi:hypothetical protein